MPKLISSLDMMVKSSVTGVAPSATANTYGTSTDVRPHYAYVGIKRLAHVALTSGGTFGAETLTVRIRTRYRDGSANSVTKTFTATGGETALTNAELHDLLTNELIIEYLSVDTQSTIASSTATGGAKYAFEGSTIKQEYLD